MSVRRAVADDWRVARDLRLRALRDEPLAFASTYAREIAFDDAVWQQRIASAAQFLALEGETAEAVGTVTALTGDEPGVIHLVAMYVRPESRGHGHGARLVAAVVDHARARGAATVRLCVVDRNVSARRLYERAGFRSTGVTMPLPHAPQHRETELELSTASASVIEPVSDPG